MLAAPRFLTVPALSARAASPFESPLVLGLLVAAAAAQFLQPADLGEVVRALKLPDNDDAMRLVEVRDLIAGQGWFDPVQHRHLPPGGVATHWSRLVDAPLAGLVLALAPLLGMRLAEGIVAALWPPLLFSGFNALVFAGVRPLFGWRAALLAVLAALQTGAFIGLFAVGRIDHHNVQALTVLGVATLLFARGDVRRAAAAGGLCAVSLAVGLETLPFVATAGLVLAVDWVRDGGVRPLLAFALALALGSGGLFLAQTAPALWAVPACDALSPPWLGLAGLAAAGAGLLAALAPSTPGRRLVLGGLVAAAVAGAFAAAFPACAMSPFGALPDLARTEWLAQVNEMKSVWAHLRERPDAALANAAPLLVAALAASILAWRESGPRARALAVAAAFLWPGILITNFQIRGIYVASALIPLVAGVAFDRALTALRKTGVAPWRRAAMLVLALAMLGKAWGFVLVAPGALLGAIKSDAAATTAEADAWRTCTDPARLAALDALAPTIVLAPIDLGPSLLLRTRHAIVAAPYHRAVPGLMAAIEGLGGGEADLARHVAATHADLVLLCDAWLAKEPKDATAFATRLGRSEAGAPWLEAVRLDTDGLKAWRVRRERLPTPG